MRHSSWSRFRCGCCSYLCSWWWWWCCCCWLTLLLIATSIVHVSPDVSATSRIIHNLVDNNDAMEAATRAAATTAATMPASFPFNDNNISDVADATTAINTTTTAYSVATEMMAIMMELSATSAAGVGRADNATANKLPQIATPTITPTTTTAKRRGSNSNSISASASTSQHSRPKDDDMLSGWSETSQRTTLATTTILITTTTTTTTTAAAVAASAKATTTSPVSLTTQRVATTTTATTTTERSHISSSEAHMWHEHSQRRRRRRQTEADAVDKCRLFVEGEPGKNELYSPDYPNDYPKNINCTRVITAPKGQIIRLDFRNSFHIEAKEECKFDFLEIRDGQYGFSNLLGKFCGTDFPPEITSKERYLWLHFHSDESIEYSGFTAVYEFIDRNREAPSTDLNCTIEKDGFEGFINSTDVPQDIKDTVGRNKIPLDCMWRIQVQDKWKIQVKFLEFKLSKPNDCETNFLDIFPEETVMPLRVKNFCGSAGEGITSDTNILHMRFYAEQIAINSTFAILFTAFRDRGSAACTEEEYDCEDATCIDKELKCNGRDNCKFRWDEEGCTTDTAGQSEHVTIIIVVFGLILGGMVITFLVNCIRKIMRDQKIIREHIRQSKESKLNEMGRNSKARSRDNISAMAVGMSPRKKHSQTSLQILDDVSNRYYRDVVPVSVQASKADLKEKEHSILRHHHHHDMVVQTSLSGAADDGSSSTTAEAMHGGGNACDMGCQTRESLFATALFRQKSISSSLGAGGGGGAVYGHGGVATGKGNVTAPPRFSTFGYEMQQVGAAATPPPPPPPVAAATLMRHSIRIPHTLGCSLEMTELDPHQHQSHTHPHHHMALTSGGGGGGGGGGSSGGRPQEMCHHHHQHQQHLQQQQQQQQQRAQHQQHGHQHLQQQQQQQQQQPHQHQSKAHITPISALALQGKAAPLTATTTTIASTPTATATAAAAAAPGNNNKLQQQQHQQQQQKVSDASKVFLDIRNSAPDVIIMTSH